MFENWGCSLYTSAAYPLVFTVIHVSFNFALLRSVIGLKNLCQPTSQK